MRSPYNLQCSKRSTCTLLFWVDFIILVITWFIACCFCLDMSIFSCFFLSLAFPGLVLVLTGAYLSSLCVPSPVSDTFNAISATCLGSAPSPRANCSSRQVSFRFQQFFLPPLQGEHQASLKANKKTGTKSFLIIQNIVGK